MKNLLVPGVDGVVTDFRDHAAQWLKQNKAEN